MRDDNPVAGVLSILVPTALAGAVLWALLGGVVTDAVFAALKLVVAR